MGIYKTGMLDNDMRNRENIGSRGSLIVSHFGDPGKGDQKVGISKRWSLNVKK
jgi:hypothetical protein